MIRPKWHQEKRNIQVGDVVLVADHLLARSEWPLGRVEETYAGADQQVRTVKVRMNGSEVIRPISKICLLEDSGQQRDLRSP